MNSLSPEVRADKLISRMRAEKHTFKSLASRVNKPDGTHPTGEGLAKMIRNGTAPQTVLSDIARILRMPPDEASEIILGLQSKPSIPSIEEALASLVAAVTVTKQS